jgi:hypothetical protein
MQEHGADRFLQRNFGQTMLGHEKFFLQQGTRAKIYISTLTVGPYLFIAGNNEGRRGVNWESFYKDTCIASYSWHFHDNVGATIQKLSESATAVLNKALPQKRTAFDFKHDILWDTAHNSFTLIQSRVSSRKISEEDLFQQNERLVTYLKNGVQIVSLEPSQISKLHQGSAPEKPFVLELTNDGHLGMSSIKDFNAADLTNMVGLIVPEYLRGGLLHHDGYRYIAYALYWGLPISFSA